MAWKPQGAAGWLLTASAGLLAALMAWLAFLMAVPVSWDGSGKLGALALSFPLHLLACTLIALALAWFARRRRARLASWVSGFTVLLTAAMALTPAVAIWLQARQLNVPLSLFTYLASSARANAGAAQQDRSAVYGTAQDGTKLELDVWRTGRPDAGPLRPAVVMVHGGAWTHGNRSMTPDWNRWLNELGYEVFDVEYRLPPPTRWEDEVGDVKAALGWVAAHAAEYYVDPARISVMGISAGGNLAMLAAYGAREERLPPSTPVPPVAVRSVINLYGPTDLALAYRSGPSLDYARAALREYVGGTPEEFSNRYRLLSPLTHARRAPPTLMILGASDRLVPAEQAEVLGKALTIREVYNPIVLLAASDHGFDVNWGGFGTQIARAKIKEFLERP